MNIWNQIGNWFFPELWWIDRGSGWKDCENLILTRAREESKEKELEIWTKYVQ